MPDEITVTPKSAASSSGPSAGQPEPSIHVGASQLVTLFAAGLGASFFLPWARFLGAELSGFDLQKMGEQHRLLWLIPLFSAITMVAGITRRSQRTAAQLTGTLPFLVAIYWYYQLGRDLTQILSFGAYLSLACGLALNVLARRFK